MDQFAALEVRLARGDVIVIDGGMGTELQARGVCMDDEAWSAVANMTHEAIVREIHEAYIAAGADVIIANTYAAVRVPLERAGLGDRVAEVNRRAVRAAQEARSRTADRPVAIAGSMSIAAATMDLASDQGSAVTGVRLRDSYREQALALAAAGVDLIALEMMTSTEHAVPALEAARETALPVWLGLSVLPAVGDRVPPLGRPDDDLGELLRISMDDAVAAVIVMHSLIGSVLPALDVISRCWSGPIGAYPHVGTFQAPTWTFGEITPDAFAGEARTWIDRGVRLVGGCCGIRPAHIRALGEKVRRSD